MDFTFNDDLLTFREAMSRFLMTEAAPERLREIAPEVQAACERHGVRYRKDTWPATLRKAFAWIHRLSKDEPRPARAILREMA